MVKRKIAATKKNCSMFNEETLTFDFIYRAFKNNPLEFLNNEELDMILLFASGETSILKVLYAVYKTTRQFNPFNKDCLMDALRGSTVTEEDVRSFWISCFEDGVRLKLRNAYYAAYCFNPHQDNDEKLCVFASLNNKDIRSKIWSVYNFNLQGTIDKYLSFTTYYDNGENKYDTSYSVQLTKNLFAALTFNYITPGVPNRIDSSTAPFGIIITQRFFNKISDVIKVYSEHTDRDSLDYVNNLNLVLKKIKANAQELYSFVEHKKNSNDKMALFYSEMTSSLYGRLYSLVYNKACWSSIFRNFGARLQDGSLLNEDWVVKLFYIHPYTTYNSCSINFMAQGKDLAVALYTSDLPNAIKNKILVGIIKHLFHGIYLGTISGDSVYNHYSPQSVFERMFLHTGLFTTNPNLRRVTTKLFYTINSLFPKKFITELAGEKDLWMDLDFIYVIRKAQRIYYSSGGRSLRNTPKYNTQGRYAIPGVSSPLDTW